MNIQTVSKDNVFPSTFEVAGWSDVDTLSFYTYVLFLLSSI